MRILCFILLILLSVIFLDAAGSNSPPKQRQTGKEKEKEQPQQEQQGVGEDSPHSVVGSNNPSIEERQPSDPADSVNLAELFPKNTATKKRTAYDSPEKSQQKKVFSNWIDFNDDNAGPSNWPPTEGSRNKNEETASDSTGATKNKNNSPRPPLPWAPRRQSDLLRQKPQSRYHLRSRGPPPFNIAQPPRHLVRRLFQSADVVPKMSSGQSLFQQSNTVTVAQINEAGSANTAGDEPTVQQSPLHQQQSEQQREHSGGQQRISGTPAGSPASSGGSSSMPGGGAGEGEGAGPQSTAAGGAGSGGGELSQNSQITPDQPIPQRRSPPPPPRKQRPVPLHAAGREHDDGVLIRDHQLPFLGVPAPADSVDLDDYSVAGSGAGPAGGSTTSSSNNNNSQRNS